MISKPFPFLLFKSILDSVDVKTLIKIDEVDLLVTLDELSGKSNPDFLVTKKRVLRNAEETHILLELDHVGTEDISFVLSARSYRDEAFDFRIFATPDFFKADKRSVLERQPNASFLFDVGKSYPQEIYNGSETYVRKVQDEVFVIAGDNDESFASKVNKYSKGAQGGDVALVEWIAGEEIPVQDYLLLLIETGIHNEQGGWVEFYQGRTIRETDIKL